MTEQEKFRQYDAYLTDNGDVKAPIETRRLIKRGLNSQEHIEFFVTINRHTPVELSLSQDAEDLRLRFNDPIYRVEPELRRQINEFFDNAAVAAVPLMPVGDFAMVGYIENRDRLLCVNDAYGFERGKRYRFDTMEYAYVRRFTRRKVHWDQVQGNVTVDHDCSLRGIDVKLAFENGKEFLGHPKEDNLDHIADSHLWDVFERPVIETIADARPDDVATNLEILQGIEQMGDFEYKAGQRDYIARMAVKDFGYAAGETGVGKTLIAISMVALKGAGRTLIIAPQGTIKGDEHTTSQWVEELRRFAPFLQVFELFNKGDYERIKQANDGQLPPGVYITYYEAMFQNEAIENIPKDNLGFPKWDDQLLCIKAKFPSDCTSDTFEYVEGIGNRVNGIKGIAVPSLSTLVAGEFDMICLDEAQYCKNSSSNRTKAFVQLEARYRFAFTATPIPNTIVDLFPIMGWLCVPQWWRGGRANVAWPYRIEDEGRFVSQFTSKERDYTREAMNRSRNRYWRGRAESASPIISSPARLLRLLQPTMAFISKRDCCPHYIGPNIRDVRVQMGEEQRRLYGYFMDRGNVVRPNGERYRDQRIVAGVQASKLRAICTDPASVEVHDEAAPNVISNFNPKVIAILELVQSTLARGSQVVIINSRIGITNEIQRRLEECGVLCSRIDSTKGKKAAEADRFKKRETHVMLMGLNCAAGYSFDQCDTLIIASIEYTPGSFTQAIGRVDRITSRGANIYCILCDNTIESMMFDTVAMKDDAAKICLHGERVPREFTPVDMEEVLADAITSWSDHGQAMPEVECEEQWPSLREAIKELV